MPDLHAPAAETLPAATPAASPAASTSGGIEEPYVGPPKPAGFSGRWVVFVVVIGSLLITAGFTAVKAVKGSPDRQNKAKRRYTDGLGALERIVILRQEIDRNNDGGDADAVVDIQKQELAEWRVAEEAFDESLSTGIVRRAVVGWAAEVKRRNGDLTAAERLFNQALADGPPPQSLKVEELVGFEEPPDPADLGGRALARFAVGNRAQAAEDARRALAQYDAGAATRAGDVWTEFAPDRARLEQIASSAPGD